MAKVKKGKKGAPKPVGRPVEPVPQDIADKMVDWLASGRTLTSFMSLDGMPKAATITEWKQKDAAFAERFARAREAGASMMIDEGQDLLDEADAESIQVAKEQAAYRLKRAACFAPHLYGTKVSLGGDASAPAIKVEQSGPPAVATVPLAEQLVRAAEIAREVMSGQDEA